eukprot:scaffold1006_cov408-Prasinococcus_capsulatus_cf.AAC.19
MASALNSSASFCSRAAVLNAACKTQPTQSSLRQRASHRPTGALLRESLLGRNVRRASPHLPTRLHVPRLLARPSRPLVVAASEVSVSEATVNKGLELFDAGKYEEAIGEFERALTLDPNDEEEKAAHYNKACAQLKLGREDGAIDSLRAALECGLNFNTILKVRGSTFLLVDFVMQRVLKSYLLTGR